MSRLTKNIREEMARALVNHRYTEEAKAILHKGRDLSDRVYNHCYTPEIVAAMKLIEKRFPDAFCRSDCISANAGGYSVSVGGTLYSRWVKVPQEAQPERILAGGRYHKHSITDEALAKEVQEWAVRKEGFDDVCKTAYHEALSVLNTMTTGKKLAEAWPEAMPVIGNLIPEDQRTLPVVQVSAINAKFKLPPETETK